MNRVVARFPAGVEELCVLRLGLVVRKLGAWPYAVKVSRAIRRSASEAIASRAGLLASDLYIVSPSQLGVFQYWSSFEALEAWSHRPPHSDWWRGALERMRNKGDFGIFHETYVVAQSGSEAIYLDCPPIGLSAFGETGEATGAATTSRDRLGRREAKG